VGPGWHVVCWNCDAHLGVWLDCRRALSIDICSICYSAVTSVTQAAMAGAPQRFNWRCAPPLPTTRWSAFTP